MADEEPRGKVVRFPSGKTIEQKLPETEPAKLLVDAPLYQLLDEPLLRFDPSTQLVAPYPMGQGEIDEWQLFLLGFRKQEEWE